MQKKGFGKAIIIGMVSGVVAATAAAYFIWEYAKQCAYIMCVQEQIPATFSAHPELEPKRETFVVKYKKDSHYNTGSDLEPLLIDAHIETHEQPTIAEAEPFEKVDAIQSSAPKKSVTRKQKSRRKRKHKKIIAEETETVTEAAEQLQETSESIAIEPDIAPQAAQSFIATPMLELSFPENETPQPSAPRTLHVHNNIPLASLQVKHWTGTYTPTKLTITINDVPFTIVGDHAIPQGATHDIVCSDDGCIKVEYRYEFMNGMRTGTDTIIYAASETAQDLHLRFSWDTAWHVELDGAERKAP